MKAFAPLCVVLACGFLHADEGYDKTVRPFFVKHCLECHGDKKAKGDLRLDSLKPDLATPAESQRWSDLAERIRSGEMPPKSRPRPAPGEIEPVLKWIEAQVQTAEAKRRALEGRAAIRRLNRVEYNHTLQDLLGIEVDLTSLLPEDASVQGFDNVDAALSLSPVLIEQYLAAADAALDAAIIRGPSPDSKIRKFIYKETKSMKNSIKGGSFVSETDDAALLQHDGYTPYSVAELWNSKPGKYRFRISAYAHKSQGKPVTMAVYVGNFFPNSNKSHLVSYFDVPAEMPTVIEFYDRFETGGCTVKPVPVGLGNAWRNDGKIGERPGPWLAVQWIEVEGPLADPWPPTSHRRLLGNGVATLADADKLLAEFLPRCFRRPVPQAERASFVAQVKQRVDAGKTFEQAMRYAYKAALCSPHFLFLAHEEVGSGPAKRLSDIALASRLSYFLWSSMPDELLMKLAVAGALHEPKVLRAEVERMLRDPKADRFTEHFTGQWLALRNIEFTTPDRRLYPDFDDYLQWSSLKETKLFFEKILREDRSVLEFVDSDWAMLNDRLAKLYAIPGVEGGHFRKVELKPEWRRGGVLTQASVLRVTANGTNTSPVVRGAWVMDRIAGRTVPPPPPNIPAVEPDIRGAVTIREQLAKHRTQAECASCHAKIDPPGFALENFDVIGGYRDRYRITPLPKAKADWVNLETSQGTRRIALGLKVDAGDVMPDGRKFADINEYKKLLLSEPEPIVRGLASKLAVYATGHRIEGGDRAALEAIAERTRLRSYGFRSLIHEVVQSELFLRK